MLDFPEDTKNEPKCYVTHGTMGHLDPKQPPVKRKPFAAILNEGFIQKAELILPEELYEIIKKDFFNETTKPVYSRVILPLKALLEGEFFNEYIKKGILTLYLDKESYERAGLTGVPDGVKGKRKTKPRWVVEINLRLPSMLHGKKGFDRIVYAFKNVLSTPVTWLFCDLGATALAPDPLDIHFPTKVAVVPDITSEIKVNMPSLKPPTDTSSEYGDDFKDFAVETHEWLSLISLNSPRVNPDDQIDSFLSRYVPPGESTTRSNLVKITWRGFLSPSWAHKLFVHALLNVPQEAWFVYYVGGFGGVRVEGSKDCTILKVPDAPNEYLLWEVA
ncbi:hypothetical protein M430DRAFT_100089 [Amorphotheca resinae ATCC 22711]|uniref:Uncharacterized protein n=1 Tax=Amorphotheca resinae ATCC 22711 TaxID=857342 RepID=A0A2T3B3A2_AMORE|nr:hypothetical protein M430DRAFT_100089 [Amorphotheca resinae ATCC 22711]PSS20126.1 hypothetical protein M430DRAFT_100089 [Amorphotheca resinae ATCC 22711]